MTADWWNDPRSYRERLKGYSTRELEDVFFHLHIVKYPEQYAEVLTELRSRRLKAHMADRAFASVYWDMSIWLMRRRRLRKPFAVMLSAAFGYALTSLALAAYWLLIVRLGVNNLISSLVYLMTLWAPAWGAWAATPRDGFHGRRTLPILVGVALAYLTFATTGTYAAIVEPLFRPESPGVGGGVGIGF